MGGEEIDVPEIVGKNLIGEVEIMVGLEGQLRFLEAKDAVSKGLKLEMHA